MESGVQELGKLDGKVAFVTGAARGQGRCHVLRLAEEGADIIAVDICMQIPSVPYPLATPEDLLHTAKEVEALDRRIVSRQVDVRDASGLKAAFEAGVAELGPVEIVVANAGIAPMSVRELPNAWEDVIDVNLTGVYNTVQVTAPAMIEAGRGGAIVLTSSVAGLVGIGGWSPGSLGYCASKHGVVGLMRSFANLLAEHSIRVNSVHPTGVSTPMVINEAMTEWVNSDFSRSGVTASVNALPVGMIDALDVSNAVAWLVSDEARYVTGVALPIDAGFTNKR
jgi:SDR family mycofactocin-dependent oxidoreductase